MESLLHVPADVLPSSGLDFLLEIHLRRANTDEKAPKMMTKKERTMIRKGARKERTMIIEEASKIIEITMDGDESIVKRSFRNV
jgi:hypothetical protein